MVKTTGEPVFVLQFNWGGGCLCSVVAMNEVNWGDIIRAGARGGGRDDWMTHTTLKGLNETVFQKSLPYSHETLKCSSHSCSMMGLYWIERLFHIICSVLCFGHQR